MAAGCQQRYQHSSHTWVLLKIEQKTSKVNFVC
jgi:hypothetical protein